MPETTEKVFLGLAILVIGFAVFAVATTEQPASAIAQDDAQQVDSFDPTNLRRVNVDDLMVDFTDNEVAANDKWLGESIALVGYSVGTTDGKEPTVELKGQGFRSMEAQLQTRDQAAAIRYGETVELLCLGASSKYGAVTAHDCELSYHGKRRKKDPYWATPAAIQDPL